MLKWALRCLSEASKLATWLITTGACNLSGKIHRPARCPHFFHSSIALVCSALVGNYKICPRQHPVTRAIILDLHLKNMHFGPRALLANMSLADRWPKISISCYVQVHLMADLPKDRVNASSIATKPEFEARSL